MATARVFNLEAFKEAPHLRQDPLVIVVPNGRTDHRRIGRHIVLQRHGNIDQPSRDNASSGVFSSSELSRRCILPSRNPAPAAQRQPSFGAKCMAR
jgi:hypothetical protein